MTKLIVQIPCLNEAETLPTVIAGIPREISGIDIVEILVIDDGSTDGTAEVARSVGVEHIVRNERNLGLAKSFSIGLEACLKRGADIIVNVDGDNQYPGEYIPGLVRPLLEGQADVCVADRQTSSVSHFSPLKRLLQKWGSGLVRYLSGVDIPDAVSGFRALNREAALRLSILSTFSYTIEMLIQAGQLRLGVTHVPIQINPKTRESRLFTSNWQFVSQAAVTIIRVYVMYRPLRTFCSIGIVFLILGLVPFVRFVYFFVNGQGDGHVQSLIFGSMFVILGVLSALLALVADIISRNRLLLNEILLRIKRQELDENLSRREEHCT